MNLYQDQDGKVNWRFNLDSIIQSLEKGWLNELVYDKPFEGKVLLIYGKKSDQIDDNQLVLLKKWFPNIVFECIEDANHYLHIEHVNQFLDKLLPFVNQNNI